ncbi:MULTISPECIES: phosphotriesterase [unclassified Nocardia]|uniref:phosphotriesterase family protein n=1 Tax=unclassified Nocardia TaxID=2637762 RepID=UPI001CE48139|nr:MULTISPECIES: phosphotriesterase-related protein [unclassified Nocardia]
MPTVQTVRGAVDVDDLGQTLMHEHVFTLNTEHLQNYGDGRWWDEEQQVADAIARLRSLVGKGVRTFVDPTVWGIGRYIPRIQRINEQVPELNIIVATGYYHYTAAPTPFLMRGPGLLVDESPDPLALEFVRDIRDGIADTGVRAAFLKCAVEHPDPTPDVERICRAIAYAHRATGAPITVHTNAIRQTGRWVLELFRAEGVDLTKVVMGHSGDTGDLDYLTWLADTGAILGMDRFGVDLNRTTPERVGTVAELCRRGYADRMVLSHDAMCWIDWFGDDFHAARAQLAPNWHYEHIHDDVLPALRAAGVGDADIEQMLVTNPRRYFSPSMGRQDRGGVNDSLARAARS